MSNSSRLSALCDKIIEAGWLAAVVLVPLFFNIYSSRVFEPDKITLLRSIALIMVAAWIVRTIEERAASAPSGNSTSSGDDGGRSLFNSVNWRTPLILPTLVLVVVYIIATVFSITPRTSLFGSYQRLQGTYTTFSYIVVFLMIVQGMRQRRQLDRLVTAIVMTSLPIAFYGVLQRVERDPLPWGGDVTQRVAANMGNAIFVAAYLIMAFFLSLGRVIEAFRVILTEEESRLSDILRASAYIFVGAVQLIAFAFAGSRGPLLGWLPGMFIFGLVGLLMLRVTLKSAETQDVGGDASRRQSASVDASSNLLGESDVLKALALSITSLLAAGVFGLLAFSAFPDRPQVELAAVAALIGGLLPLLVVAGIQRASARWLWASWIFFSIVGAAGLFLINFSDHPRMVELRENGTFGSLGTLFESEGGTGRVRTLIWEGAVNLVEAHEPITFPDGTSDPFNAIRTVVGYGPESMYVAYNRFYPPDLAHYEARNASPDRSHNETWDSLVITGAIGFVAEQFLFLSVFFFALKFIGWLPNRQAAITFLALMIFGGMAGAIGLSAVPRFGVKFMGTGWPGGVTAGIMLYVILFALFHFRISTRVYAFIAGVLILIIDAAILGATFTTTDQMPILLAATAFGAIGLGLFHFIGRWAFGETAGQPIPVSGHIFLIIALFGGILAHYLEISLAGIAIAATRTYFWTFAGLLVVTGLNRVPADAAEAVPLPHAPPPTPPATAPTSVPRHKKKRKVAARAAPRAEPRPSISRPSPNWLGPTIAGALIGALILITLGYEFINTPPLVDGSSLPQNATQVLWSSLTRLPYKDNAESPGTLLMFLVTWLFGGVVTLTELRRRSIIMPGSQLRASLSYFGISVTVAFVVWMMHGSRLLGVLGQLATVNAPAANVDEISNRFVALAEDMAGLLGLFYVVVVATIVAGGLSLFGETRPRALPVASEWGLIVGVPAFIAALALLVTTNFNPIRADIVFKQGQPYIANNACNGAGAPLSQCDIAVAHLKQALQHAPEEDFYMLSLGASFLNKSAAAADGPPLLIDNSTFQSVLNLDAGTTAQLNRHDALTAARVTLEHARQVNPLNTDHSANLARLHRRWSDLAADTTERRLRLDQASDFYKQATALSPHNAQLWNEWAVVFFGLFELASQLNESAAAQAALQEAQARLDESLVLDKEFCDTYTYLASLYGVLNQPDNVQTALAEALRLCPDNPDAWARLTEQLFATGNVTEAEQLTLDFVSRNPAFLPGLRTLARRIYFPQGRLVEAIDAAQRAVDVATQTGDPGLWDDQLALAEMLRLVERYAEALPHAQAALDAAPPDRKAEAQGVYDAIVARLNGSSQPGPSP